MDCVQAWAYGNSVLAVGWHQQEIKEFKGSIHKIRSELHNHMSQIPKITYKKFLEIDKISVLVSKFSNLTSKISKEKRI
jgi:hypothetical protein